MTPPTAPHPRYTIVSDNILEQDVWHIVDTAVDNNHIISTSFERADAEFIAAKLNTPCIATGGAQTNPRLRPLSAMEICDFRLKLEYENGGPLIGDPQFAFILSDLCDFLGFNTGERALALGARLLVYLSQLDYDTPSENFALTNQEVSTLQFNRLVTSDAISIPVTIIES